MAELARVLEDYRRVAFDMLVELNSVFHPFEQISQQLFALHKRLLPNLGTAELQHIESQE